MKKLKVAFVHDYLKEIGGAEMVLIQLKEIFPDAPVYTAFQFPDNFGHYRQLLSGWDIRESWGKFLPFLPKFISYYTIISPLFFSTFNLSAYDLVIISATGGYFPNGIKRGPSTKVITYCHTPPRFLYGFPVATQARYKWYWRPLSEVANHILRIVDFKFAQKPDLFIANSQNVARRIKKFYRRDSVVIYPPIEIPKSLPHVKREDYFLSISRIVGSKNVELAAAAANRYHFKLKIAGRPIGPGGNKILSLLKGPTIEYLGEVSQAKKYQLFSQAKAFLALESDADFGMSTVEPQAFGTPVVALRKGGYLETVVENKTGVFFDALTEEALWHAITKVSKIKWNHSYIRHFAKRFSREKFNKRIKEITSQYA